MYLFFICKSRGKRERTLSFYLNPDGIIKKSKGRNVTKISKHFMMNWARNVFCFFLLNLKFGRLHEKGELTFLVETGTERTFD